MVLRDSEILKGLFDTIIGIFSIAANVSQPNDIRSTLLHHVVIFITVIEYKLDSYKPNCTPKMQMCLPSMQYTISVALLGVVPESRNAPSFTLYVFKRLQPFT